MTDNSNAAPERIWAWPDLTQEWAKDGGLGDRPYDHFIDGYTEYIRADLANAQIAAPERIIAAALRYEGIVFSQPRPARHGDIMAGLSKAGLPVAFSLNCEQGFLASDGEFVGRREAADIAILSGQIVKTNWGFALYSEDLW